MNKNTMTISIDIPNDIAIDIDKLSKMATEYVQHHIYMLQETKRSKAMTHELKSRCSAACEVAYPQTWITKSMIEEALTEKVQDMKIFFMRFS